VALVRRAVELGVNFIDTADVYGLGRSEELVGQALAASGGDVLVATKGGSEWDPVTKARLGVNNRPEYLRRALENSLRRLARDHVDVYYLHRVDDAVPLCDSFGELLHFKTEGKIRAAGLSNVTVAQIQAAMCAGAVEVVQNEYHLFLRDAEDDMIPFCDDNDIAFIPYGPLAHGILGGRYGRDFRLAENDWRRRLPLFSEKNFGRVIGLVEALRVIADAKPVSLPHLALRWLLCHRFVASAIVGAKRPAQVEDNVRAVGWDLTDDELDRVDELTADLILT
jgi:aryl-alcohol dehydrogenase-like predicted oxidoreductase